LSIALWNDDPEVREDVIDALAEVGGVVAIGLLEQSLSDDDAHLREVAAEYLAEIAGATL
jgi:HEAT repeat protein